MGYRFRITRSQEWVDDVSIIVTTEEWLSVASTIEGLRPISEVELGPETVKLPPEWQSHRWYEHPEYPDGGPIFELSFGEISFRGHDPATMSLAFRIAERLGCRVFGEGGEEYTLETIVGKGIDGEINPFTGEPIASHQCDGVLEVREGEIHLTVEPRGLFGRLMRRDRRLLYFVVPPPAPPAQLHRSTIRARGEQSDEGAYGADGSCKHVFYVLKWLDFVPAS